MQSEILPLILYNYIFSRVNTIDYKNNKQDEINKNTLNQQYILVRQTSLPGSSLQITVKREVIYAVKIE